MSTDHNSHKITTRFVIFTTARSGSTALTGALNAHPQIYCHGHAFFQNARRRSALRPMAEDTIDLGKRESDPVGYAYDVLNFSPGPAVVGYKLWRSDDHAGQEAINALGPDPRVKKIILERANVLACLSSEALVHLKQKTPGAFSADGARPQLDFDAEVIKRFTAYRRAIFNQYRRVCEGDVLHVPYVGLMERGVHRIGGFLNVRDFDFKARTEKRNSSDILGRYKPAFHDEILRTLDDIGHPEWVSEG